MKRIRTSTTKPKVKPEIAPEKPKKISTIEIECEIAKYFGVRTNIIVPNISWGLAGMHECDMFIIKKTGFAVEVEIKISKSDLLADLLADFKKGHSHIDRKNRIVEFYYAMPFDLYEKVKDLIPEGAGIITCEWNYNAYRMEHYIATRTQRQATRIKGARALTIEEQFKVAKLGCMRIFSLKEKIIKNGKAKV